ncbi:hypothetical protein VPH35_068739 [Triticum aestivum]
MLLGLIRIGRNGPWVSGLQRIAAPLSVQCHRHRLQAVRRRHPCSFNVLVGMRGMARMLRETSLLDPDLSLLVFSHLNKFKKNLSKIPRASVQLHIRVYYVDSIIFRMLKKNMMYALLLGPTERTLMLKSRKQF